MTWLRDEEIQAGGDDEYPGQDAGGRKGGVKPTSPSRAAGASSRGGGVSHSCIPFIVVGPAGSLGRHPERRSKPRLQARIGWG